MVQVELLDDLNQLGGVLAEVEQQFGQAQYAEVLAEEMLELEKLHDRGFAAEQSPGGEAWQPLAPSTVRRKGHSRILHERGPLSASLGSRTSDSIRDIISEPPHHQLIFGTSDEKSIYHQDGTTRIPQREHVGTNEERLNALTDKIADSIVEQLLPKA